VLAYLVIVSFLYISILERILAENFISKRLFHLFGSVEFSISASCYCDVTLNRVQGDDRELN